MRLGKFTRGTVGTVGTALVTGSALTWALAAVSAHWPWWKVVLPPAAMFLAGVWGLSIAIRGKLPWGVSKVYALWWARRLVGADMGPKKVESAAKWSRSVFDWLEEAKGRGAAESFREASRAATSLDDVLIRQRTALWKTRRPMPLRR